MVTIELLTREELPRPAVLLKGLIESGKLSSFVNSLDNSDSSWHALCQLEEDVLSFERRNRWCGSADGWNIVVGRCDVLPQVPSYNDWGNVAAWAAYDDFVVVIDPTGERVLVWDAEDFYTSNEASVRASSPFADDSAMRLNPILKAFARLDS
jgi:hypothetical protein